MARARTRTPVRGGKKIDTYRQSLDNVNRSFTVDLYLTDTLTAVCPELDVQVADKDLGAVRRKMRELINERMSFTWEPWLEINVTDFIESAADMWEHSRSKMQLVIEITQWEFSIRNNEKFHRLAGSKNASTGWVDPEARKSSGFEGGMFEGHTFTETSVIRDTPEARAALEVIGANMLQLSGKLGEMLSQKNIDKTLVRVLTGGSLLALTAPEKKK